MRTYEEEFDYVYRALRRHGVAASEAEDLAQEVFLIVWRRWSDFDPQRPLRPWLAGITFRVAHDHFRRRWREVPDGNLDAEDAAPRADDRLATARAHALVLRALGNLPERHRTLVVLLDLDGVSVQEVAALLSVPPATIYTRLRRARIAFSDEVAQLQRAPVVNHRSLSLAPEALLEIERSQLAPAPADVRRRLQARVRALAPAAPGQAFPPARPRPFCRALPVALEVAASVVAASFVVGALAQLPAGAGTHAAAAGIAADREKIPHRYEVSALGRAPVAPLGRDTSALSPLVAGLGRDLVGYWRFDEGPGSGTARDLSGQGNHCALRNLGAGATWVSGRHGGAVELSGDGWLECEQPELPEGTAAPALSIALWVKRSDLQLSANAALVTREMGPQQDYFFFGFDGYKLKATGHAWLGRTGSSLPASVGRWTHVAYTHDAEGTTRLYVDGVEVAHNRVQHRRMLGGRAPLMVGAGFGRQDRKVRQRLRGRLDELLIYDRALCEEEVAALAAGAQPAVDDAPD